MIKAFFLLRFYSLSFIIATFANHNNLHEMPKFKHIREKSFFASHPLYDAVRTICNPTGENCGMGEPCTSFPTHTPSCSTDCNIWPNVVFICVISCCLFLLQNYNFSSYFQQQITLFDSKKVKIGNVFTLQTVVYITKKKYLCTHITIFLNLDCDDEKENCRNYLVAITDNTVVSRPCSHAG